ncbi:MAG: site-specific integrase [Sphingomonadaceae bacterium]|nr:site-specific integrase [Sphingomonadaceae bacterium]
MAVKFARLTRPAIRAMEPGQRLNEHGITAEKQRSGDVRYSINIMADGARIHRVVGRESEGVTREQAERLIEKLRTEAREGRLSLPKGRKLHLSFAEAATKYIERLEATDGKNLKPKRRHLRNHLTPYFGTLRLDRLTEFGLKQYRKKRREAGAADSTINREMATLSHLLRSAASKDWRWIKPEDVPLIPKEHEAQQPMVVLTDEQANRVMGGAIADQDGLTYLFVAFGLNTAMRHREILSARFDQIDAEGLRIHVPLAKAGSRDQPITAELVELLKARREQLPDSERDGWIFPTAIPKQAKQGHRTRMDRQFERAVTRAGLDPRAVTPHTMRRTAITKLIMAGVDLPTAQRISGHRTLAMLLRYFHAVGSHVNKGAAVLGFGISGAITPELHTAPEAKPQAVA